MKVDDVLIGPAASQAVRRTTSRSPFLGATCAQAAEASAEQFRAMAHEVYHAVYEKEMQRH